jgi:hypothetical protein
MATFGLKIRLQLVLDVMGCCSKRREFESLFFGLRRRRVTGCHVPAVFISEPLYKS